MRLHEGDVLTLGITITTLLVGGVLIYQAFSSALDLPVLHLTYPGKECVKVISQDPNMDCANKPSRYHLVYVAPKN